MKAVALVALLLLIPCQVFGAAFLIYNQDAKANGMGLAVTSSIDNPSAVFYNPALLPDMQGISASAGLNTYTSNRYFKDAATGVRYGGTDKTHYIPTFFATYTCDRLSFGLGVYTPFGLSSEWPETWIGRYQSTFAEIKTTFINPVVAYKVHDYLSLAFGVSVVKSSVEIKNNTYFPPFPDGVAKLKGDGTGVGFNAAAAIKLPKETTVAVTFRSPIKIDYDGDVEFRVPPALKPFMSDGDASTSITLPFIITGGISKKFGNLTIEGDIIFTGWSAMDKYVVTFTNGMKPITSYKDWSNSPSFAVGANYRWNKYLETQVGYMYDRTPVPERTLSPELPDSSRNLLTCGATVSLDAFKIGLGYQATFFNEADSRRNVVGAPKGKYNTFANVFLLNVSYAR